MTQGISNGFTSPYEEAINRLQTNLIVSVETAKSMLAQASAGKQDVNRVYYLVATYFPQVITYHLAMFQAGEKLHRANEQGNYAHLLTPHVSSCATRRQVDDPIVCSKFSAEFREFYTETFFDIILPKLEILLFNLQALHQQIGVANFKDTFKVIQQLNENGVVELLDFSWHCKAHRLSEIVNGKNATAIFSVRAANIPAAIQTRLANETGFPDRLRAAHHALKYVLLINFDNCVKILETTISENLIYIPKLANILRTKAVLIKLAPNGIDSNRAFRNALIYGSIPTHYDDEIEWARFTLLNTFDEKTIERFVSDALIERVTKQLPLVRCQGYRNCIDIVSQEHNVKEYVNALDNLAAGLPMPHLELRSTPLLTDGDSTSGGLNALNAVGLVGITFAVGVSIYAANSLCRQFGFWNRSLGLTNKTGQNKPVASTAGYRLLPH